MVLTKIKNYFRIYKLRNLYLKGRNSESLQETEDTNTFYSDYNSHGLLKLKSDINFSTMPANLTTEHLKTFYSSDTDDQLLILAELIAEDLKNIEEDDEALNEFVYEMN